MRILVIDDDLDSCDILSLTLGKEGYEVICVRAWEEGLRTLERANPALIILDVMLPGMRGWDLCKQIRTFSDVPILLISAFARTADDLVRGVDSGADGYLPKPIDSNTLKANVKALLRRSTLTDWRSEHLAYVDSHLTIDLHNQQVFVQGALIALSRLEYQLLEVLVNNANYAVPTIEIEEELWPGGSEEGRDTIDVIHTYVGRLRRKIEPDPRNPVYLVNEYGLGYCFVKHV